MLALDRSRSMAGAAARATRPPPRAPSSGSRPPATGSPSSRSAAGAALTGFSTTHDDAGRALARRSRRRRQGTALYDAVVLAADAARRPAAARPRDRRPDRRPRRVERRTLDEAIAAARRAHAGVYPIAVSGAGFDAAPLARARARRPAAATTAPARRRARARLRVDRGRARAHVALRYTTAARPGETIRLHASHSRSAPPTPRSGSRPASAASRSALPAPLVPAPLARDGHGTLADRRRSSRLLAGWPLVLVASGGRTASARGSGAHVAPARAGSGATRRGAAHSGRPPRSSAAHRARLRQPAAVPLAPAAARARRPAAARLRVPLHPARLRLRPRPRVRGRQARRRCSRSPRWSPAAPSRSASRGCGPSAPEGVREPAPRPADHDRGVAEGGPQLPPGNPDRRRRGPARRRARSSSAS